MHELFRVYAIVLRYCRLALWQLNGLLVISFNFFLHFYFVRKRSEEKKKKFVHSITWKVIFYVVALRNEKDKDSLAHTHIRTRYTRRNIMMTTE